MKNASRDLTTGIRAGGRRIVIARRIASATRSAGRPVRPERTAAHCTFRAERS
jgi:hypothetical protein